MAPLKISIPTTHDRTPEHGKSYTEYTIRIEHPFPRATTTVAKRYSDFDALDSALRSSVGTPPPTPLPPKSWFGGLLGIGGTSNSPEAIEKRRQGLEAYLHSIEDADDGRWRISRPYRAFLELDQKKAATSFPGAHFGKDRVRDSTDWLDKQSELKSALQDARRWIGAREAATSSSAMHEASANAKKSLVRAGTLVSALDEGLSRLGGSSKDEWSGEKLGPGEVRRRRDEIAGLKKEREGLEGVLSSVAVKSAFAQASSGGAGGGAMSNTTSPPPHSSSTTSSSHNKSSLFSSAKQSSRRVLGGPAKETDKTRELDNDGVLQLQRQVMREQDEDLVDLATVVRRMRELGVQMNEEMALQNAMLGLLEEDVERVDGKIKIAKKRLDKIN